MNAPLRPPHAFEAVSAPADDGSTVSLVDALLFVSENWKALFLLPFACGVLALAIAFAIPPTYTATTRIIPPQQAGGAAAMMAAQLGALAGLAGAAAGIKNPAEQYVSLINSRSIADRLIERFDLMERYKTKSADDTRRALTGAMSVGAGSKDGVISIEVDDRDPQFAATLANAAVEETRLLTKRLALTEASQRRQFFESQLHDARKGLVQAESALRASGLSESTLRAEPRAAVEEIARLKAAVTLAEIKVASLSGSMAENNPDLKQARQDLGVLRAQLARTEQGSNAGESRGGEYMARYRDFKFYETLFEMIAKQTELARLDEARESGVVQVIDVAVAPDRKSKPKRGLIAVAATLVTFVLIIAALVLRAAFRREIAERMITTPDKVRRLIGVGRAPRMDQRTERL